MNPFISFCLYVAARVFVQYLKSRPEDSQTGDSLRFLLSAMNALKKKNPLTESFLVQLDVDLEGLGMRDGKFKALFAYSEDNVSVFFSKSFSNVEAHNISLEPPVLRCPQWEVSPEKLATSPTNAYSSRASKTTTTLPIPTSTCKTSTSHHHPIALPPNNLAGATEKPKNARTCNALSKAS